VWTVELSVMASLIALNSVFAAYEIALASVSLGRLQILARSRRRGAASALNMKRGIERSLAVVQLGITLVGAVAAATGGAGAAEQIAPALEALGVPDHLADLIAILLVVLPLTIVTIVCGELVPKLFALRNAEWFCLTLSPAMGWFAFSVWPIVYLLERSASALMRLAERCWRPPTNADSEATELLELQAVTAVARTARLIGAREESIILGAAKLASRTLDEIMLPAEHIGMLSTQNSIADCLISAHLDMHTRFPVTERPGDPQGIVGYVNFKDLVAYMRLNPQEPWQRSILRPIPSLAADMAISHALESLIRERTHIALVREIRDDSHRVVGLVTLEDILEEMVGEIQDEFDSLPAHLRAAGSGWVAGGGLSLVRLRELTGIDLTSDLPESGARHLSAWVAGHSGGTVRGGEIVQRHGIRLVVRKVRRHQVLEAQLMRESPVPAAPVSDNSPRV